MLSGIIQTSQRDEQPKHIVRAFENAENTQITQNAFQSRILHIAHSTEDLAMWQKAQITEYRLLDWETVSQKSQCQQ